MPSIGTYLGYKFFFYSNENDPLEPVHIHIGKNMNDKTAKVWLLSSGETSIEYNHSIPNKTMNVIQLFS